MTEVRTLLVKICGNRDNIAEVASLNPDYMGFIFYQSSPRYVGDDFKMPTELPNSVKRVGVFVNEDVAHVKKVVTKFALDFVQLHGIESVEECKTLKEFGVGVIKVFSIDSAFDFDVTLCYEGSVDYFLFDTKGKFFGGNAVSFDWSLLTNYHQRVPFFLGGGLTLENISSVKNLRNMNVHAVDVNSGVEDSPGHKIITHVEAVIGIFSS